MSSQSPKESPPGQTPEQIHLSLTNLPSEMIITWITKSSTKPLCQYRGSPISSPNPEYPDTPRDNEGTNEPELQSVIGSTITYSVGDWKGFIHFVKLTGLQEKSTYVYRVGDSESGVWSREYEFVTRRSGGFPFTAVVFADFDTKDEILKGKTTMLRLAQNVSEFNFVLEFGDISYADGDQSVWDSFFNLVEPVAARVPWMVTVGNHEKEEVYGFEAFERRFQMPGKTNFWYSFDYGYVHFVVISTEHPLNEDSEQYKWLIKDLKSANKDRTYRPWLVVTGHRALIGSNKRWFYKDKAQKLREILCPLFDKYRVDLALFGHCHAYERTHPIVNGKINPEGTIYLLAGVAGAKLDKEWEPQPRWSAYRTAHHGYGLLHSKSTKKLRFCYHRRSDGKMWDSFTIKKAKGFKKQILYDYENKFLSKWYPLPYRDDSISILQKRNTEFEEND